MTRCHAHLPHVAGRQGGLNQTLGDLTMTPGGEHVSALSVQRAFVVHFALDDRRTRRRFAGRAEHLSSGDSIRFSSLKELLAFIATRLDAVRSSHTMR